MSYKLKFPKNYLNAYCGDANIATLQDLPLQYIAVLISTPVKHWLTIKITNNKTGEVYQIREDVPEGALRRKNLWHWADFLPPLELTPAPTTSQPYEYNKFSGELKIAITGSDVTLTGTTRMEIPHTWETLEDSGLTWGELEDYNLSWEQLEGLI